MTTSMERTRALYSAGELLRELLAFEPGREFDAETRTAIRTALRHFPSEAELLALSRAVMRHCPRPMLYPIHDDKNLGALSEEANSPTPE